MKPLSAGAPVDADARMRRAAILAALAKVFEEASRRIVVREEGKGILYLVAVNDDGGASADRIGMRKPGKTSYARRGDPPGSSASGPKARSISTRSIACDLADIRAGRARMSGLSIVRTLSRSITGEDVALVLGASVEAVDALRLHPLFRVASIMRPEVGLVLLGML